MGQGVGRGPASFTPGAPSSTPGPSFTQAQSFTPGPSSFTPGPTSFTPGQTSFASGPTSFRKQSIRPEEKYRWEPIRQREKLPDRAVLAGGKDGETFVAKGEDAEAGKLTLESVAGPRCAHSIWTPSRGESQRGHVLVLNPGFRAVWAHIRKDDRIPEGAVCVGPNPDQGGYVARKKEGEAGNICTEKGGVTVVWCQSGKANNGEILRVEEVADELEVRLMSSKNLRDPEYRAFGFASKLLNVSQLKPYVAITFGGVKWESGYMEEQSGTVAFNQTAYFQLVSNWKTHPATVNFVVKDKHHLRGAVRGDPKFGEGSLELTDAVLTATEPIEVKVERSGQDHGSILVQLRLLGRG